MAAPAARTVAWDVSRTRPGTSELAVRWIDANVPQGAAFVKEAYTPDLDRRRYTWRQARYAARLEPEELRHARWDYLLLARNAHRRFLSEEKRLKPHHQVYAERYREMFGLELVERFAPGPFRSGPDLLLYRLEPREVSYLRERRFEASEARYLSHASLGPVESGSPIRFGRKGQSVIFKEHLEAGSYDVRINRQAPGVQSWLYVITRDNLEVGEWRLDTVAEIELPHPSKYFLRVFLWPGGELRWLRVEPSAAAEEEAN